MKSYNQFCPIAKAAEIFCERWTALILRDLGAGSRRFSELQRGVPLASPSLLSQRLKQLQAEGIIEKQHDGGVAMYHLTEAGKEFVPIVEALGIWGQRWSRRELAAHEMDLGLLLWALEQDANPACFDGRRTIIELRFPDQPSAKQTWWFLNEDTHCELCLSQPGADADIYVMVTLEDIIRIWRGDISLQTAEREELIEVHATQTMRAKFRQWLAVSSLADVKQVAA